VTVSWTLIPQQYQSFNSMIGLFQFNNQSSPQYAQKTMSQCGVTTAGLAAGSCQFPLSRTLLPGTYEFRYYGYNSTTGYRLIATSSGTSIAPATPTPSVTPTATVVPTFTSTPSPTATP
jgi:hypothetical protein